MSDTKHTPGPWEEFGEPLPGKRAVVGIVGDADEAGLRIADVGCRGQSVEEIYANARLIAAAPDLLALAKRILAQPMSFPSYERKLAEAAIAKAESK